MSNFADLPEFDRVRLEDVDPNFSLIDEGVYTLQLSSVAANTYERKSEGVPTGEKGVRYNLTFTVVDDEKFSGRRVRESFFPSDFFLKCVRRVADATGYPQDGDSIAGYLESMAGESDPPVLFKAPIGKRERKSYGEVELDSNGNPVEENFVKLIAVMPA